MGSNGVRPRARFRRFAFHTMTAAQMAYGFFSLNNMALQAKVEAQYGGFAQFLTIIGLFASTAAMVLSSINDLLPSVPLMSKVKRMCLLFAMPVEIVIASIYWPLVLIAPNLMFPPALSSEPQEPSSQASDVLLRIPISWDLSMHALPTVALLLDFFILEKKYTPPASTIGAPLLALSFGLGYSLWVEHCAAINGSFPYPFLNWMEQPSRGLLYATATLGSFLAFRGLNWAHR